MDISLGLALGLLILGSAIGAAVTVQVVRELYQRGFEAGQRKAGQNLSLEELRTIHWLAINGFRRLLLLHEKGSGGFLSEASAEAAHQALDRLEFYLPKKEVRDSSFDRMRDLSMHFPEGPLDPAHEFLKETRLQKEP